MATPLFTIGYEGKTVDEFLGQLKAAGVKRVVDVRAIAASRRPGFSKIALAGALAEQGIGYMHLRALGTPKAGRDAARKGRTAEMRAIYEVQLASPEAALAMAQAIEAVREMPSALLCFEAEAAGCHRAMVVERMQEVGAFARHDL